MFLLVALSAAAVIRESHDAAPRHAKRAKAVVGCRAEDDKEVLQGYPDEEGAYDGWCTKAGPCAPPEGGRVCDTREGADAYLDQFSGRDALFSGASAGADTLFKRMAHSVGHATIDLYSKLNHLAAHIALTTDGEPLRLSDAVIDGVVGENVAAEKARGWELDDGPIVRGSERNFFQVYKARTIYAVAYRNPWLVKRSEGGEELEQYNDICMSGRSVHQDVRLDVVPIRSDPHERRHCYPRSVDIGGGTGVAVQMHVNFGEKHPERRAEIYFYDDGGINDKGEPVWLGKPVLTNGHFRRRGPQSWPGAAAHLDTWRKWSRWNWETRSWEPLKGQVPPPKGLYAGIGGTRLTEFGQEAIRKLYRVD